MVKFARQPTEVRGSNPHSNNFNIFYSSSYFSFIRFSIILIAASSNFLHLSKKLSSLQKRTNKCSYSSLFVQATLLLGGAARGKEMVYFNFSLLPNDFGNLLSLAKLFAHSYLSSRDTYSLNSTGHTLTFDHLA